MDSYLTTVAFILIAILVGIVVALATLHLPSLTVVYADAKCRSAGGTP